MHARRPERQNEHLLHQGAAALPERVPDDVDGRLALGFLFGIERYVGHLLHGSNSAYFVDFDAMFCAAPTSTASISGVVPSAPQSGAQTPGFKTSEKNTQPVASSVTGVTAAATPQPNFLRIL